MVETANRDLIRQHRRWHWSTWIIVFFIVIATWLVNFPARNVVKEYHRSTGSWDVVEHGWPFTYRVRLGEPYAELRLWSFDFADGDWRFDLLFADLIVAGIAGWGAVALWERRRRIRGSIWRFSLREALSLTTGIAIVLGWLKIESGERHEIEAHLQSLNMANWVTSVPRVPEWLRKLVGDECWDWFPLADLALPESNAGVPAYLPVGGGDPARSESMLKLIDARPDLFGLYLAAPPPPNTIDWIRRSPKLRHIHADGWTNEILEAISKSEDLTTFDAQNARSFTAADATILGRCQRLKVLILPFGNVPAEAMAELANLRRLETLELWGCSAAHDRWQSVARLTSLRTLLVPDCDLTDEDMVQISRLPNLEQLVLKDSPVTDFGLGELQNCPRLWYLDLSGTDIGNVGIENLSKLPRLKGLRIAETRVGDECLGAFSGVKGLRHLTISETDIRHIERLDFAALPRLRSVVAADCPIARTTIVALATSYPEVTIFQRADLDPNANPPPPIQQFNQQTFSSFVENDWALLPNPDVTNQVLRDFVAWIAKNHVVARKLSLGGASISDEGLRVLRDLPDLIELDLTQTQVTPAGVAQLVDLSRLESVTLDPHQIDERSAASLQQLPHLKSVLINESRRPRDARNAVDQFKELLPQIRVQPDPRLIIG